MLLGLLQNASGDLGWYRQSPDPITPAPAPPMVATAFVALVTAATFTFVPPIQPELVAAAQRAPESQTTAPIAVPGASGWQPRFVDLISTPARAPESAAYVPAINRWGLDGHWRPRYPDRIDPPARAPEGAVTNAILTGSSSWQPIYPDLFHTRRAPELAYGKPPFPPAVQVTIFYPSYPDLFVAPPRAQVASSPPIFVVITAPVLPRSHDLPAPAPPRGPVLEYTRPVFVVGTSAWQPRHPDLITAIRLPTESRLSAPVYVPGASQWPAQFVDPLDPQPFVQPPAPVQQFPFNIDIPFFGVGAVFPDVIWVPPSIIPWSSPFVAQEPPTPPPPPPPRPAYFTGGSGASAGGGGFDWNDLYDPIAEEYRDVENAAAEQLAMGDEAPPADTLLPDYLSGVLRKQSSTATLITELARAELGKHGAAAASVATMLATMKLTKSGFVKAGSALVTLESLYQLYAADNTTPPTVHRITKDAFVARLKAMRLPISVRARQVLMKGKSGRVYSVLVVQYTMTKGAEAWFCQEGRRFASDGTVDIVGTLLERLTPKR